MKKEKITILKEEKIQKEIQVELPYFATDGVCHWYKVISEHQMLKVFVGASDCALEITEYNIKSVFADDKKEVAESEFLNQFNKVINQLNEKI